MPYEAPNPWDMVLNEIRGVNARIDKLVTTEAFVAEQRRVDERLAALGQDIQDERLAREKGDLEERTARKQFVKDYDDERKELTRWQRDSRSKWILAIVGLIASPIVVALVQNFLGGR